MLNSSKRDSRSGKGKNIYNEIQLAEFLYSSPGMLCVIGDDNEIIDVNPELIDITGFSRKELIGEPVSTLYSLSAHNRLEEIIREGRGNGRSFGILEAMKKNGEGALHVVKISNINYDRAKEVQLVLLQYDIKEHDISERMTLMMGEFDRRLISGKHPQSLLTFICNGMENAFENVLEVWIGIRPTDYYLYDISEKNLDDKYMVELESGCSAQVPGNCPLNTAIRKGTTQVVSGSRDCGGFIPRCNASMKNAFCSSISIPVHASVGVVGVMNLFIEKSNEFSQEQVDQISELVNHVALVLESSHSKKALEESERRFHDVLDNINLVAVNLDVSGNITYCNDYLLELTGWNRKDVLGQNWADVFLASDHKDDFKDMFFENIQSGNIPAHYEEADILTRQRERRLIFWNNTVLHDPAGNVVGTASIGEDITKRRRMEEELRASEEKFSKVFMSSPDIIVISDFNTGRIVDVNDSFTSILGYSREEAFDLKIFELFSTSDYHETIIRNLWENGAIRNVELKSQTISGETCVMLFSADMVEIGEERFLLCVGQDITERTLMEDRLRNSLEHYSAIVNSTDMIIIELDSEFRLIFANTHMENLMEKRNMELAGKSIDDLFQHSFAIKLTKDVSRVFETSDKIQTESKLELDGMNMDVLIMIVPITGKDGNVDTVMVTIRNISDLKAAEKLRMENLALEEASKIKNVFLTSMSHELRTPLNAIIGYSEMLRDNVYGEQNAEQVEKLDMILSGGNSLLGVISDILDLSKIEAGKLEFKVETVKVEDIINDTLPLYMPMADEKRQIFSVDIEPGLVITTDTIRVKQCLNNLVKNAIKFTPDEGRILIEARRNKGFIEFTVIDTGRGISPEKIESVFQPFFRVDKNSDDKTGGAGLGLSVTKNLVEMMGGTISVTSDEGEGSTFSFMIPERINLVTGEFLPEAKTQQSGFGMEE